MENLKSSLFHWASLQPMTTVSCWTEAQPERPNQQPLASPCRQVGTQRTASAWSLCDARPACAARCGAHQCSGALSVMRC
jgi:hypothetical protein